MKPLILSMMLVAAASAWASSAEARQGQGYNHHQVNQRQHHQQGRIGQGMRSGELTRHEARRLGAEQRGIRQEERRYMADGHLSRYERADLRRDQNAANRHIWQQKHDGQQRGDYRPTAYRHPGVNQRQENQRYRIAEGSRSGALTGSERRELNAEQRAIRQEERQYRSDGTLTRDERKDLYQDQKLASQHIYQETHDAERR
ncbi:MAG: hypothetical protein EG825_08525 [Rhodocyclaceae bacterium]|nr:hypothetical protein [Rhodocyclaceae bacterium]